MNKKIRHDQILDAIKQDRVMSQEALREILHAEGTDVTQATVSRDIRELRLVKVPGADGTSHYSMPDEWESTASLRSLLPTLFQSADGVDPLLVIRTMKGAAQTVAAGIDWEEWPEVLGTLAGDDTVLIILRSPKSLESIKARIEKMASRPG